ncbi:DUF4167 domain-containing protein [Allorhizobium undicola]
MRPGQQNKRSRGRSNGGGGGGNNNFNRKGSNPLTRTYDSSGPDVKIRGTAQHIAEKYMALARDAQSAGDRVMAENYLQHAEHYNRIIASAQAQMQERVHRDDRDYGDRDTMDMDGDEMETVAERPQHHQPQQQHRQPPAQPQPQPQPVQEIAGSGPQPVIDETPVEAEMAAEESVQQAGAKQERQQRRRSPASRPRRPRRNAGAEGGEGGEGAAAEGG